MCPLRYLFYPSHPERLECIVGGLTVETTESDH